MNVFLYELEDQFLISPKKGNKREQISVTFENYFKPTKLALKI